MSALKGPAVANSVGVNQYVVVRNRPPRSRDYGSAQLLHGE